jgi:histidine triad (HIT) family protein
MVQKEECIFCTLGNGNPRIIFEDEVCYVIPDRFPSEYSHLLVIAKDHSENMLAAPDSTVSEMFLVAKKFGLKLESIMGADGVQIASNVGLEAGQIIFHFHIHIIPKYDKKINGFVTNREIGDADAQILLDKLKS